MPKAAPHLLSGADKVWKDIKDELEDKDGEDDKELAEEAPVPVEELKKVSKLFQHTVTKFGASAAVSDGPKDPALKAVSEELVKAFVACEGTLLSVRRGAGASLRRELREVAGGLAEAISQLGSSVGSPNMAVQAGKALDRCKHLERMSPDNRSAVRRRLLTVLKQIRDANREFQELLQKDSDAKSSHGGGDDDFDDFDLDEDLDAEERPVVEAVVAMVSALEDTLKQASQACAPRKPGESEGPAATKVADLEVAAKHAALAASCLDCLGADMIGGLDTKAFSKSLADMDVACTVITGAVAQASAAKLRTALDAVKAAVDACEEAGEEK